MHKLRGVFRKGTPEMNAYMNQMAAQCASSDTTIRLAPRGTALGMINELIEKKRALLPVITRAKATEMVLLANPMLYDQYLEEMGKL